MARDHALGAWGKASPAVLGSAENCDPQTSTSAPARGSEKPERPPQPTCSHCYRRFKTAEQLTAHVAKASHSRHDPRCGACGKHFANLDTLRQHLAGQLPNKACAARFRASGCPLCLAIGAPGDGQVHACPFEINLARLPARRGAPRAVALDCEMVGVEPDGGGAMCVRVCVVDERGETLLNTFVKPSAPVTDYRAALTGVDEENAPRLFAGAPSLPEAREMVLAILNPGSREATLCQTVSDDYSDTDCAPPLVVGHDLAHDLACLGIASRVPARRLRDTARYAPFERHTRKPYKLRVLAKELLNVDIQSPNQAHDPREDALAAMRLYVGGRELCAQFKKKEALETLETLETARDVSRAARHDARGETKRGMRSEKTEKTEPKARFRCWCLDGCLDQTPPPLAPLAPSHARSTAAGENVAGVFYKTEATREPKRALRDATNA